MKTNFLKKLALIVALTVAVTSVPAVNVAASEIPAFKSEAASLKKGETKTYGTKNNSSYSASKAVIGNRKIAAIVKVGKSVKVTGLSEGNTTLRIDFKNYKTKEIVPARIKVHVTAAEPEETAAPVKNALFVGETAIKLGDTADAVKTKLGIPERVDKSCYGDTAYIYNADYKKFSIIYLQDNKVVGYYSDAVDFSCNGVKYNDKIGKSFISEDGYTIKYYVDETGNGCVNGVRVFDTKNMKNGSLADCKTEMELQVFDLTNSIRARNGLNILKWSDMAAASARAHSKDMMKNNYFDHTNLDGKTPWDRMEKAGINGTAYGENIIGGYGDSVDSAFGWYQSPGHRKNMLNENFTYLGVGMETGGTYRNYYTQNFYRE